MGTSELGHRTMCRYRWIVGSHRFKAESSRVGQALPPVSVSVSLWIRSSGGVLVWCATALTDKSRWPGGRPIRFTSQPSTVIIHPGGAFDQMLFKARAHPPAAARARMSGYARPRYTCTKRRWCGSPGHEARARVF